MKKTIIITGNMKGGTTAVAGVFRILGLFIGDTFADASPDKTANEDKEIAEANLNVNEVLRIANKRDESHDCWGWKHPASFQMLNDIMPFLRNPHIVLVFRDPVAVAMRHMNEYGSRDTPKAIDQISSKNREMAQFYIDNPRQTTLVSYEKLLTDTKKTINDMIKDTGMTDMLGNEKRLEVAMEYIKPHAGYLNIQNYLNKLN